jgi:transposase-like protein
MNAMNDDARQAIEAIIRSVIQNGGTVGGAAKQAGITYNQARTIVNRMRDVGEIPLFIGRPEKLTPEQKSDILAAIMAGEARANLAKQYGVGTTLINSIAREWKFSGGNIPQKALNRADVEFFRHGIRRGSMIDVFKGFTHGQIDKIAKDIPQGCTVADWLRSIVIDVVEEIK